MTIVLILFLLFLIFGLVEMDNVTYRQSRDPSIAAAHKIPWTLDGMAFMKVAYPGDYAGIRWLNNHVEGTQIIAEAPECNFCSYDWTGRVTMFTGLPDVQGGIHEGEQRWGDELTRVSNLRELYSTSSPSIALHVIRIYGIRYIFVGFVETHCLYAYGKKAVCFPRSGIAKFRGMIGHGLSVAYAHPGVVIYQVTNLETV